MLDDRSGPEVAYPLGSAAGAEFGAEFGAGCGPGRATTRSGLVRSAAEGGAPLCTIVGTGRRTGALWAALCNGTAAHALDSDDTDFILMGHLSAPLLAATLATAELVLADVRRGLVSRERARTDYGVALRDGDLEVDRQETARLRR